MRAAVCTRYGPPDVIRLAEVDKPTPGPDQVLVRVHATTVNRTDCGFRAASPWFIRLFLGFRGPRKAVLGSEFAGQVEAVGDAVTRYAPGDRVFGFTEFGAHAEYVVAREDRMLARIPEGLSYADAAPSTEGSQYALSFLRTARFRGGEDVLVNGATGAIGSAAVQLLKTHDVTVTATCDTRNIDLVKSLGADRVIDWTAEDFTQDPHTYDAVLDAVGKSTFGACRRLLKPGGLYVSSDLGPYSQNPFLALVTPLFRGRRVRFPLPGNDPDRADYFRSLIEAGTFRPVIDRRYPFDEIVEAYRYVETGQKVGNVVLVVRD